MMRERLETTETAEDGRTASDPPMMRERLETTETAEDGRTASTLVAMASSDGRDLFTVHSGHSVKRTKGEDSFAILEKKIGGEQVTFAMVADGHGGKQAAQYVRSNVLNAIAEVAADASAPSLREAVATAFARMHEAVLATLEGSSGCTLTIVALNAHRGEVTSWNVGDSLAMLVHDGGYECLSCSHRLDDNADERERLSALGVTLGHALNSEGQPRGPLRGWPGGLAVTRTLCTSPSLQPYIEPRAHAHAATLPPPHYRRHHSTRRHGVGMRRSRRHHRRRRRHLRVGGAVPIVGTLTSTRRHGRRLLGRCVGPPATRRGERGRA
jgi:serine/threonine protein phosphatase PrpC